MKKKRPTLRVETTEGTYRIRFAHNTPVAPKGERPPTITVVGAAGISAQRAIGTTACHLMLLAPLAAGEAPLRSALAACSASERGYSKEFGRQLALARAIVDLPVDLARRLLGAYMASASRELVDLSGARVGPYPRGLIRSLHDVVDPERRRLLAQAAGAVEVRASAGWSA
jgi:hypothetical protein